MEVYIEHSLGSRPNNKYAIFILHFRVSITSEERELFEKYGAQPVYKYLKSLDEIDIDSSIDQIFDSGYKSWNSDMTEAYREEEDLLQAIKETRVYWDMAEKYTGSRTEKIPSKQDLFR